MNKNDIQTHVWNDVFDGERTRVSDDDAARRIADDVVAAMKYQQTGQLQAQRVAMVTKLTGIGKSFLAGFLVVAALGGIGFGINTWTHLNDNDWAGYGPSKVEGHNTEALGRWIGHTSTEVKKEKVIVDGHHAWATQYFLDNRNICVYVWDGTDENSYVKEGGCK